MTILTGKRWATLSNETTNEYNRRIIVQENKNRREKERRWGAQSFKLRT